jgi:NCAIR mutase (PurE)-related protein
MAGDDLAEVDVSQIAIVVDNRVETVHIAEPAAGFSHFIVAAGMDAALVSVVGGLVSSAVIASPTSVGYGVAAGGTAALHAVLASCVPGISVVSIDNGYSAACAALRISRAMVAWLAEPIG